MAQNGQMRQLDVLATLTQRGLSWAAFPRKLQRHTVGTQDPRMRITTAQSAIGQQVVVSLDKASWTRPVRFVAASRKDTASIAAVSTSVHPL